MIEHWSDPISADLTNVQFSILNSHPRGLEKLVTRSPPTLRRDPVDDFVGIHDVAGFAVDTVGGVDLKPQLAGSGVDHFVNRRGAEVLARVSVFLRAARVADVRLK